MSQKPSLELEPSRVSAPSAQRIDPWGWVALSLALGSMAAAAVLWMFWRSFPGVAAPVGTLGAHVEHWAKLAGRFLLPSWFAQEAAAYVRFWASLDGWERFAILWRGSMGLAAFFAPAILTARSLLAPRDGLIHVRGGRRFEGAEAVRRLGARLAASNKARPDFEVAPRVPYPSDMWTRHVLIVGGTGSGKSTAMKPLINKVVASGDQALIFDPKSEFTIGFGKPAILAPWDDRSLVWDLARDMRNALDMRRFAAAMIKESHDPMWSNASRQLLVGLMLYLKGTRGDDWGWSELADLLSQPQASLLPIMREWHPEAVRSVEKAGVTTAGILINLSSFCSPIFDLAEAWGDADPERRVGFVEWTLGRSAFPQIILQGHGAYGELTKSYVEGVMGVVSAMVNSVEMRDDPKRRIWFIADELPQAGKIPIRALFEVGRSRGVRCVVACQDFAQLEDIHGAQMVKALIAMSGTLLVGQVMPGDTAKALCDALGTREVERQNISSTRGSGPESRSLSFARDEVALYKPAELASRLGLTPDGRGVKLALFTGGDAYELFWPRFTMREEREGHQPAAWTLGPRRAPIPAQGDAEDPATGDTQPSLLEIAGQGPQGQA